MTNFILIDFENVPLTELAQLRARPFKTKIFCGALQSKIPVELAAELQPLGADAEYIRIQGSGPNALDFHIAYYIGRLSECPGAEFHVISKDKGFDPLLKHLKASAIECHRWPSLELVPGLGPGTCRHPGEHVEKVLENLQRSKCRPRRVKTLTNYVKGILGQKDGANGAVDSTIVGLQDSGAVCLTQDGKVTYNLKPIEGLSAPNSIAAAAVGGSVRPK